MPAYTVEEIKNLLLCSIQQYGCEAERRLSFVDKPWDYMIIIYSSHCSFQRCGTAAQQSGEQNYPTLDALFGAEQVDGILLQRDWNSISALDCMEFDLLGLW